MNGVLKKDQETFLAPHRRSLGKQAVLVAAVFAGLTCFPAAAKDAVNQFFDTCVSTLPDFNGVSEKLKDSDFAETSQSQWIRNSDGFSIQIVDGGDRWVCMVGLTGNHSEAFVSGIDETLRKGNIGRYEKKSYQGRSLYLLQTANGMTIIEVIPPNGATTFIAANARKEK